MDKDVVRVEFGEHGRVKVSVHKDLVELLKGGRFEISKADSDYLVADFDADGRYHAPTIDPCDPKTGTESVMRFPITAEVDDPPAGGSESV